MPFKINEGARIGVRQTGPNPSFGTNITNISPPKVYNYSITGVVDDPTSQEWRENYAPTGYEWIPNVGFKSYGPLKHTDWMFHSEEDEESTLLGADITNLDMSEVVTAREMLRYADFSTNPSDLTEWKVSNIRDFTGLFRESNFNQDISNWKICTDKSNPITDFVAPYWTPSEITIGGNSYSDFERLHGWDDYGPHPDGGWSVSAAGVYGVCLQSMFEETESFDQPIGSWDTSAVFRFDEMFQSAESFNQPLNSWDTSHARTMVDMFEESPFNQDISSWDVSNVVSMYDMFKENSSFNQDISSWNTSNVINMSGMFEDSIFNQDISSWDVSSVKDFSETFEGNYVFNQPLDSWDVSSAVDMSNMFDSAESFDQPLDSWDVSNVTDMSDMFNGAIKFDRNLGSWDVSNVTDMVDMFNGASSESSDESTKIMIFNNGGSSSIQNWDVSNVEDVSRMFQNCESFNQDISEWEFSNIDVNDPDTYNDFDTNTPSWLPENKPTFS